MDTLIKFPLSMDYVNECVNEADGKVFMRYTWGNTPLAWLRQQEAKAKELVEKMNSLHDNFPQPIAAVAVASQENGESVSNKVEAPKRKGNPAWYRGMTSPFKGKKHSG